MAKVGNGSTLSQSPPSTAQVQLVVVARLATSVIHSEPSMRGMLAGGGNGANVSSWVGQITEVGQLQPVTSLLPESPSQLKSPGAQLSWRWGWLAPRQTPLQIGSSPPAQSRLPFAFGRHQPTGCLLTGFAWVAGAAS